MLFRSREHRAHHEAKIERLKQRCRDLKAVDTLLTYYERDRLEAEIANAKFDAKFYATFKLVFILVFLVGCFLLIGVPLLVTYSLCG